MAVKVIKPDLAEDPEFRARFGREVSAARKVGGQFTARVVDADTDGEELWLATEYISGPDAPGGGGGPGAAGRELGDVPHGRPGGGARRYSRGQAWCTAT